MFGRKVALLSFILVVSAVLLVPSLVFAYTLQDFANDFQKLILPSGTTATAGGIFDFLNSLFGTQQFSPAVSLGKLTYAWGERLSFSLGGFPSGYRVIEIAVLDGSIVKAEMSGDCYGCPITISSSGSGSGSFDVGENLGTGSRTLRVTTANPSAPQSKSTASACFSISGTGTGTTYDYTVSVSGLNNEFTNLYLDGTPVGCLSNTGTGPTSGPCGSSDKKSDISGTHTI